jgi:hypothetical protein
MGRPLLRWLSPCTAPACTLTLSTGPALCTPAGCGRSGTATASISLSSCPHSRRNPSSTRCRSAKSGVAARRFALAAADVPFRGLASDRISVAGIAPSVNPMLGVGWHELIAATPPTGTGGHRHGCYGQSRFAVTLSGVVLTRLSESFFGADCSAAMQ